MIEQQGRVESVTSGMAVVRLGGRRGCEACDAGRGCGAGIFGRLLRRRPVDLRLLNPLEARPGEAVIVGLPESWLLALVSRFYLYPLLAGLAGAAFGHYLSVMFECVTSTGDALTLLGGLGAGALVLWRSRRWSAEFPDQEVVHLLRVIENPEFDSDKEAVL